MKQFQKDVPNPGNLANSFIDLNLWPKFFVWSVFAHLHNISDRKKSI